MKKVLALTLTMAVLLSMTSMAENINLDNTEGGTSSSKEVTATYTEGTNGGIVYSVDITWGSMLFQYNAESTGNWNPETHEYENVAAASWTCAENSNVITVTNHSNTDVDININYIASEEYPEVNGELDKSSFSLASAVGEIVENAHKDSATLTLTGELPQSTEAVTVGSVTVTIGGDLVQENEEDISVPRIDSIVLANDWSSNELQLKVEGDNLEQISNDNFDDNIKIIATVDGMASEMKFILNNSVNTNVDYIYNDDCTATIEYKRLYFSETGIGISKSDIDKLDYVDLNSDGTVHNIYNS